MKASSAATPSARAPRSGKAASHPTSGSAASTSQAPVAPQNPGDSRTLSPDEIAALKALVPGIGNITFSRAVPSSVTTAWGVKWDEELVARDLMQNFRDANKNEIDAISVRKKGNDVVLHGPTEFNLVRLYYLGSEKGEGDIGAYGEGFKAASVALLRDFKVIPIMVSGQSVMRLSVSAETIEDTNLRPIVYESFTHDGKVSGSYLLVLGCAKPLADALERSIEHFFWPGHPQLGELVESTDGVDVYRSKSREGFGFYGGLRRLTIPSLPLIFNVKKSYKNLDKKIEQDRDRKAFDDKVAAIYYGIIVKATSMELARLILLLTRPIWHRGHPLLHRLAQECASYHGEFLEKMFEGLFAEGRYFAKTEQEWHIQRSPELAEMMRERSENAILVPSYFVYFGVDNVHTAMRKKKDEMAASLRAAQNTRPSALENMAIRFLIESLVKISPQLQALATRKEYTYLVVHTKELLGQLREGNRYRSTEVVLAADLFLKPFHTALSTLVHEYAHGYGYDGDRFFTDALTDVLEQVIANRDQIGAAEVRWAELQDLIRVERTSGNRPARDRLLAMPDEELQTLLLRAPDRLLEQLLNPEDPGRQDASGQDGLADAAATAGDALSVLARKSKGDAITVVMAAREGQEGPRFTLVGSLLDRQDHPDGGIKIEMVDEHGERFDIRVEASPKQQDGMLIFDDRVYPAAVRAVVPHEVLKALEATQHMRTAIASADGSEVTINLNDSPLTGTVMKLTRRDLEEADLDETQALLKLRSGRDRYALVLDSLVRPAYDVVIAGQSFSTGICALD